MKKNISPEVLAFLKNLPNMSYSEKQGQLTEEDVAQIKIMLNNSTDPQAQADRKILLQYILNNDSYNGVGISDVERMAVAKYLRKHAKKFYELIESS